ncbi:auxilin-like protein 1 isoform X2 [Vigna radiata var. radiata]|uniref:Auxilin-like protein 1 isoform X2 n=1 Tax=Vigna radiata var. radiata TaxID=3916 RepID=A0A1S3VLW3_VIGRR|nr:auxilin-like protein 1 isoform X2 [Vigna radiata var. radiata]
MAHSRQPNKAGVTLSNKTNTNGTFSSSKTLYDDVYGGPPKFAVSTLSPRFEDYREIFGSFHTARASSIPLLDLPAVHDAEAFFDPRSHSFNYTEVFGALDFELPSDNLFHRHTALNAASSEEAWSPAETDSFSEELDQSAINQSILNGNIFHSVDGNVGSNILYHKVNGTRNEHMSKGKNQSSQLHAVPGYGQVYDETTELHRTDSSCLVADDIDLDLDMEFSTEKVKGNQPRATTMSKLRNFTSGEQTFDSDLNLQNAGSKKDSHSGEMFITVSDINLRSIPSQVPPPSRPPPVLDAKKDMCGLHSNSRLVVSEETPGAVSPPFFDAEDHMNSSATASAGAMNEAMLRAEAQLRSTKELKGRKKWDCETYSKSSYDAKVNKAKMCKDITGLNSLNDETALGSYDWRHSKAKLYVTDDRQEFKKSSPETMENLEGKSAVSMFEEKNKMESRSSIESDGSTEVGTWKDESDFFELAGMEESRMVTQTAKQSKNLVHGTGAQKHGQKEREASNVQEKRKQVKATEGNYQVEEYEKKYKATKEVREHDENIMNPEASNLKRRQREHMKMEKMPKVFEEEENEKTIKIAHQHGKSEKKVTEADQYAIMEDICEMGHREHKQAETQEPTEVDRQTANDIRQATGLRENQKKLRDVEKQQQNVSRRKQSEKMEENRKTQSEAFAIGQTDQEEKLKGSGKLENIVEGSNVVFESDHTEETCKSEKEMRLKLGKRIQMNKGLKEAHERVEIEKNLKSSFENEESDGGVIPAFRWDENGKRLKEDIELEVKEIRLKEASKQRENKAYEKYQSTKEFEDFYDGHREGNRLSESGDGEGIQKVMNQTPVQEQINRMLSEDQKKKITESTSSQTFAMEGSVAVSNENRHLEQSENMDKDRGMEKCKGLNKALDDKERKDGGNVKNAKATDETWEIENDEDLATQSASIDEEFIRKLKIFKESAADQNIEKMRTECKVGEKQLKGVEMENQLDNVKFSAPEQMTAGDAEHSKTQSEKEEDTVTKVDCRRSTETAEPVVQETVNAQKTAQLFHIGQSTESKTKSINEKSAIIKDTERMKRENESENDHLRKMEEEVDIERVREKEVEKAVLEAEREREREKDRMAVDRAAFEARDRAYAEACEREERAAFERATTEARYKALAEARERLMKACAEARDKSYIDKETAEARLKAERAAVERATAEAQDRALEKLKNERTAFESRERLDRSVTDNFCGRQDSSSSDMLDPQFQNSSPSTVSRHPYSLYGEREGESAQRCRARLERHRRTAERAAKALAEKNMRDLLAQKEQAERNRLSETLDAEVRRWSGGKEGNLRALLSTLQYILGPDSGWQSIPLTEVITSAAVKKAYRKATLCVHPDKLQQRGASIQHKYICEKVFDLLKEAWNKFNSEER